MERVKLCASKGAPDPPRSLAEKPEAVHRESKALAWKSGAGRRSCGHRREASFPACGPWAHHATLTQHCLFLCLFMRRHRQEL